MPETDRLRELVEKWRAEANRADDEHGKGYAQDLHDCADELESLLSALVEKETP